MKVFFETYGCSYNFADSEYMQSIIEDYEESPMEEADVIVLNTCTVKNKTINNFRRKLQSVKKINPTAKVIISGCMPQAAKKSKFEISDMEEYSLLGPNNLDDINFVINSKNVVHKLDEVPVSDTRVSTRKHRTIEIVPISRGCLNVCTYCQTKLARGNLSSYRPQDIEDRVKEAVDNGTKIIYLTSQDNGCYGFDIDTNLAELVERLCKIEGDFKIRIGMANPQHTIKVIKPLMEVMKNPKVFKFLHIPAQSGSDAVLKHMKRGNKTKHFKEIVEYARSIIPEVTIATDIIVGYPTETEEDFQQTLDLIKDMKIDVVNRAKFSARPGTKAAELKEISTNEVTRRMKILTEVFEEVSNSQNKNWVGWKGDCVVESLKKKGTSVLRNDYYKPIVVEEDLNVGDHTEVEIKDNTIFHLNGITCQ